MEAAAHGHSALGIPKSVGAEFTRADDAKLAAAGIAFVTPLGHALFIRRGAAGDHAGEWCFPGGVVEDGETPVKAAKREALEEIGAMPPGGLGLLDRNTSEEGVDYTTFVQRVADEFEPELNDESTEYAWRPISEPPEPLHPGIRTLLTADFTSDWRGAVDRQLAFDRATVRTTDTDGRLHVALTNISKATVNPYRGNEIPDWEALGLDPNRTYRLFRDPDEIAKGAATFNNLPVLSRHVPVSAEDHRPELVVGSTGTDAEFAAPYLRNSMVVWARSAIDAIATGEQQEISCAYHYRADMTPGTYEGEAYDGVMRDIVGNHVALVREGRAGPDVVVGDGQLEELAMSKLVLTRKAAMASGAVIHFLRPKLAQDAKLDVPELFAGVTAKNFKEKAPAIVIALKDKTKGKLAQDASIDDLTGLLDALEKVDVAEGADEDPVSGLPMDEEAMRAKASAEEDPMTRVKEFLKGKLSDADMAALDALCTPGAMDADKDDKEDKDKKDPTAPKVTKPAMDAAIADAEKRATAAAIKTQRDIRDAERAVRPWVGDLTMAFDSGEAVFAHALKMLDVKTDGVHPSAYRTILELQPKPGEKPRKQVELAEDAGAAKSFAERFPETQRIGSV